MGLTNLVEKFIDKKCKVCFSGEFEYNPNTATIGITLVEKPYINNKLWKKYLKENFDFNLTEKNVFTMSVLHELGHHLTVNNFSNEQWEKDAQQKGIEHLNGDDWTMAYFNLSTERSATETAVKIYNSFDKKTIDNWNNLFINEIKHYEKTKKIKSTLLTKL